MNVDKVMQAATLVLVAIMVLVSAYAFATGKIGWNTFLNVWDGPIGMAFGYWIGHRQ